MHITFWSVSLKRRDHSEDVGVDGRMILEQILGKYDGNLTGFICLRIGTCSGLL